MPELPDLEIFAANLGKRFKDKILEQVELTIARISPLSISKEIPKDRIAILYAQIAKVLKEEIIQIGRLLPDQLGGEIKDFLKVHGAGIKQSPTGKTILMEEIGGRKSYYTEEQIRYGK